MKLTPNPQPAANRDRRDAKAQAYAASDSLVPHVRRGVWAPSPPRPAPAAASTSDRVVWMSADGATLFGINGTSLRKSADDGANWTSVGSAFPIALLGCRQLANGQLLVSTSKDGVSTPGALYLSSGYPSAPVFTKVLDAANKDSHFPNEWNLSTYGPIALAAEYGNQGQAGRVYLSRDSGATWTKIFDLFTQFGGDSQAHTHGVAYDPYWERIWVATGDSTNRALRYSDDFGATWTTVSSGLSTPQIVGILPLANCVLFTTDSAPNGILRIWRRDKSTVPTIDVAHVVEVADNLTVIGGTPFWRGVGYPALFPFIRSTTGAGYLVATYDGADFFTLWTDSSTYATPDGLVTAVGPTASGNVVGDKRVSSAYTRLTFAAPTWVRSSNATPQRRLNRYLKLPGGSAQTNASTPDRASFAGAGTRSIRIGVTLNDYTPAAQQVLVGQYGVTKAFYWSVKTDGTLRLDWYPDGSTNRSATSTAAPTVTDGSFVAFRVDLVPDNGASQYNVLFYTSTDYDPATKAGTWTQLGTTVTGATGVTSVFDASVPLEVGGINSGQTFRLGPGRVHWMEYLINGVVVADPDFRADGWKVGDTPTSTNAPSLKDSAGNAWSLTGDATSATVARIEADAVFDTTTTGVNVPAVTGSRGGNAALASLLAKLAAVGLITDSTTA